MAVPTIISVGELLVEFVSHNKGCELRQLSEYSGPYPSGAPAICIDQAARLGASTQIFGALGQDSFGDALVERLRSHKVDTSGVLRLADKTTGVAFVSYFDDGSRTFIFHLNNTAADSISTAHFNLPEGPTIFHISGSSLGNQYLRAAIETVATQVLEQGGKLSCDPNARVELMDNEEAKSALNSIIDKCDYLFPSEADIPYLSPGKSESEAIDALLDRGIGTVVLTKGESGCSIYQKENTIHIPGYDVTELDPTGAGDCFCGTYLAMLTLGESAENCGQFANAAGAIAVTRRGPMEGNSDLVTIKQFMDDNPQ